MATDRAIPLPLQELGQEKDHKYNQEREDMEKEIRREDSRVKRRTRGRGKISGELNRRQMACVSIKRKGHSEDRMRGHT